MKPLPLLENQRGATLMVVLVMVVVVGLSAGIAGSTWKTVMQREREEELLWRGNQFRRAIESYMKTAHPGQQGTYPPKLEDLLKDPRSLQTIRHIRKIYKDPITGEDFVPIHVGGKIAGLPQSAQSSIGAGGILGVHSPSSQEPFKKDNFSEENKQFQGKKKYSEWEFVYVPRKTTPSAPGQPQPGGVQSPLQSPGQSPLSSQSSQQGNFGFPR